MSAQPLKQQIQADLHVLKSLDLDIMPASTFYWANIKAFFMLFSGFLLIQLIAVEMINASGFWHEYFTYYASHAYAIRFKMIAGCVLASFGINLFLLGKVKGYVIFKHQISPHLQTGKLFIKKIHFAAWITYGLYALFIFPLTLFCDPDVTLFAGLGAFILSALFAQFMINMEVTRIGMGVLFGAVAQFIDKTTAKAEH